MELSHMKVTNPQGKFGIIAVGFILEVCLLVTAIFLSETTISSLWLYMYLLSFFIIICILFLW